jgi:HPt (histidine-containing phosphotransfer) domain-containing protein
MMHPIGTQIMMEQGLDQVALDRLRRLGGDQLVREMIDLFLEHTPMRIEAALVGGQAGDLGAVERAAHSLGSSAGYLGAMTLKEVAGRLEHLAREQQAPAIPPLLQELDESFQQAKFWLDEEKKGLKA